MRRSFSQLSLEQRVLLSQMLKRGLGAQEISEQMDCHISTVYREIKRGMISDGSYDPYFAEKIRLSNQYRKIPVLLTEKHLSNEIADFLLNGEGSLQDAINSIREKGYDKVPTIHTLYSSIDKGLIPGVTRETLRRNQTKMFNNGQIHIPKWIRDKISLSDGDELSIKINEDRSILIKKTDEECKIFGKEHDVL